MAPVQADHFAVFHLCVGHVDHLLFQDDRVARRAGLVGFRFLDPVAALNAATPAVICLALVVVMVGPPVRARLPGARSRRLLKSCGFSSLATKPGVSALATFSAMTRCLRFSQPIFLTMASIRGIWFKSMPPSFSFNP